MNSYQAKERQRHIDSWNNGEVYLDNGVPRWLSSSNVPPKEIRQVWVEEGFITEEQNSKAHAAEQVDAENAIRNYIAFREEHGYSDEERFEMRAAFGEDAGNVVDVFTGRRVF